MSLLFESPILFLFENCSVMYVSVSVFLSLTDNLFRQNRQSWQQMDFHLGVISNFAFASVLLYCRPWLVAKVRVIFPTKRKVSRNTKRSLDTL